MTKEALMGYTKKKISIVDFPAAFYCVSRNSDFQDLRCQNFNEERVINCCN